MIHPAKLDFYIEHDYNVLFIGKHGVGKTSVVKAAFERAGLKWKYFSASTLDPWVDLVGVPKEMKDANGVSYLDLVRPKEFQNDEIEAVFFDEFNRSHKKVRNAVMELIQFKSINGKRFNNLRMVWAAINPDDPDGDLTYDVEKLDPAQEDRFQIKVYVPYKPDEAYFTNKYGKEQSRASISWWTDLTPAEKNKISPRRLDVVLDVFNNNGDIRDVIPDSSNIAKLLSTMKHGPVGDMLENFMKIDEAIHHADFYDDAGSAANREEASKFLANENNFAAATDWIVKKTDRCKFFLPLLSKEKMATIASSSIKILDFVIDNSIDEPIFMEVVKEFVKANQSSTIVRKINRRAQKDKKFGNALRVGLPSGIVGGAFAANLGKKPEKPFFAKKGYPQFFDKWMDSFKAKSKLNNHTTQGRKSSYRELCANLPPFLKTSDALEVLDVINDLSVMHSKTLEGLPHFMGIVNHCIDSIHQDSKMDWEQIDSKFFKKRFDNLARRIGTSGKLSERLLCPKSDSKGAIPNIEDFNLDDLFKPIPGPLPISKTPTKAAKAKLKPMPAKPYAKKMPLYR